MIHLVVTQQEGMEVATNRPLPLDKGIELLNKKNSESLEEDTQMSCSYELVYENNIIYQSSLSFPIDDFSLLQSIEKDLGTVDNQAEEVQEFIDFLTPFFPKEEIKKNVAKQKVRKDKKQPKENSKLPKISKRKIAKIGVIIVSIGLMVLLALRFLPLLTEKQLTYEQLIKQRDYLQAAETYPKMKKDIEDKLNQQALSKKNSESINELKEFVANHPTKIGKFDVAILDNDYSQAVSLYEKEKSAFKSDMNRLTLIGYSYLKLDKLEEAKKIATQSQSIELEKKIFNYEQLSLEIRELENELKELEKGGSKNKEKAEKVINKKFKLQEQRLNL